MEPLLKLILIIVKEMLFFDKVNAGNKALGENALNVAFQCSFTEPLTLLHKTHMKSLV